MPATAEILAAKIAFLRSLLGPGDQAIETHFAWVFLVGSRVLKLRKPVRRDTMDYASLAARRENALAETRLNRRLAPDVYLGTRALTMDSSGRFAVDGDGEVVDWLVEMRRLDRSRMLDRRLLDRTLSASGLRDVAATLAAFYSAEPPALLSGEDLRLRLRSQVTANFEVLDRLDRTTAVGLRDLQLAFIAGHGAWFELRACSGCVIEAHGDLRPEHVFVDDPPAVIDCLEFDRDLRILDRAEELAFLELECSRLGHAAAGRELGVECLRRLHDSVEPTLQQFYQGHRAATRAKLYAWRSVEERSDSSAAWKDKARNYLARACAAAEGAGGL